MLLIDEHRSSGTGTGTGKAAERLLRGEQK